MSLDEKNVPPNVRVDDRLSVRIRTRLTEDGGLACADAFALAEALAVSPGEVGRMADVLGVKLRRCQLGLFGYPGPSKGWTTFESEAPYPDGCEAALRGLGNSPTCPALWDLAEAFGVSRLQAGRFADRLGLKVVACPLGAF
ncbi:MAG: hypothetical protein FJY80_00385 [Candidatus Aminicenantes bacterium]|nr:hypothetical protein [Candidatus Aminicenantes bacterium]